MKRRLNAQMPAMVLAAAVLMVGCGGSDGDSSEPTASAATPTVATSDGSAPSSTGPDDGGPQFAYKGGNFITILKDNDMFSTLLKAVTEAGLTDLLEGDQPLTIFAPVNKAFDDLPDGVLEKLLKPENRDVLLQILKYHIVEGNYRAPDIPKGDLTTLQGSPVSVEAFATDDFTKLLMVNGKYSLIPNMEATNGTIHLINWIMLPPGIDLDAL